MRCTALIRNSTNWLLYCLLTSSLASAASVSKKISLDSDLTHGVNEVLNLTSDLQQALYQGNEKKIKTQIDQIIMAIYQTHSLTNEETNLHVNLRKVLENVEKHLISVRGHSGEARSQPLQEVFRQLVNIVRSYNVKNYRIFFCGHDSSVWIQKGNKPQNPIHPDMNCGTQVQ